MSPWVCTCFLFIDNRDKIDNWHLVTIFSSLYWRKGGNITKYRRTTHKINHRVYIKNISTAKKALATGFDTVKQKSLENAKKFAGLNRAGIGDIIFKTKIRGIVYDLFTGDSETDPAGLSGQGSLHIVYGRM